MSTTKIAKLLLSAALSALLLSGCAAGSGVRQTGADAQKPIVYASFYPMYDLAEKAAGDLAEVRCLIPDGTEPHDWEPSPQDIIGLKNSDLFFYSGAGFETWAEQIINQTGGGNMLAVETSAGIELTGESGDPHVWLSPKIAKRQFDAMCAALASVDPANADGYAKNRERWDEEFDRLDEEYSALRDMPRKTIVVTHEAFGYLCADYGLTQLAAVGYSPDAEPDPGSMARLVEAARENGVTTVFYEELSSSASAKAIAGEIGAKTVPLSPLEGLSNEQRENGDDYFSVMRKNLEALKEALA